MGMMWKAALSALCVAVSVGPVMARDLALIVANTNYDRLPDIRADIGIRDLTRAAENAGIDIDVLRNAESDDLQAWFADRIRTVRDAERLYVFVVGHIVDNGGQNYLLGTDAPRASDMFRVGSDGVPLDPVLRQMSGKPGGAVLLVASARRTGNAGPGLGTRFTMPDVPQGVTVVRGSAEKLADFLEADLFPATVPVGRAVKSRGLAAAGFLPEVGYGSAAAAAPAPGRDLESESAAFRAARRADTAEAFERYLREFPDGVYADLARERYEELSLTPEQRARAAEAALNLNRDARREIQRDLSILEHDPRGIDGIFGNGTRAAIRSWQRAEGIETTGYLSGNQISRLHEAAAARQAQLEEEARIRQEEADRADGAYWRETGRGQSETGLRQYLERYPDGLFSDVAEDRLAEIEVERRASARADDRRAWEAARQTDTLPGYQAYLREQPDGAFVGEARAKVRELKEEQANQTEVARAKSAEDAVLVNPITRRLVERRLVGLGLLEANAADGTFDRATRRAIRRYQRARDIPITGFVDQRTLVRMLAGN